MDSSTKYSFALFIIDFIIVFNVFKNRRQAGLGRPTSIFVSGLTLSALAAIELFIFDKEIIGPSKGIGLEKFVIPIVTGIAMGFLSIVFALITHVCENMFPSFNRVLMSQAYDELKEYNEVRSNLTSSHDWVEFAKNTSSTLD